MRVRLCNKCGEWHNVDEPWPLACSDVLKPQILATPSVISDVLPKQLQSQADGKYYDSKSSMRRSYIDNHQGIRFQEVGDDKSIVEPTTPKIIKPDRKEIRKSLERAFSRKEIAP